MAGFQVIGDMKPRRRAVQGAGQNKWGLSGRLMGV